MILEGRKGREFSLHTPIFSPKTGLHSATEGPLPPPSPLATYRALLSFPPPLGFSFPLLPRASLWPAFDSECPTAPASPHQNVLGKCKALSGKTSGEFHFLTLSQLDEVRSASTRALDPACCHPMHTLPALVSCW